MRKTTVCCVFCLFLSNAIAGERPTIGLALGGGGANGLAHIEMLAVFDELGVRPDRIAGTSIGAIIGALYASGESAADIRTLVARLVGQESDSWQQLFMERDLFRWIGFVDPALGQGGLIRGDKFIAFLQDAIKVDTFEALTIPLQVIATDLNRQEQVLFDSGALSPALEASMAIPGLFAPVTIDKRRLVDGGLVNPVPFDVLFDTCDLVVAVNVIGRIEPGNDPSFMDSTFIAVRIFQKSILREKLKQRAPEILIDAGIKNVRALEFFKSDQVYKQAQPAAQQLRTELRKALSRD